MNDQQLEKLVYRRLNITKNSTEEEKIHAFEIIRKGIEIKSIAEDLFKKVKDVTELLKYLKSKDQTNPIIFYLDILNDLKNCSEEEKEELVKSFT